MMFDNKQQTLNPQLVPNPLLIVLEVALPHNLLFG